MLTEAETEKLYKIAYDLRLAFSLRGELGKNGSMVYDVRLKRDADNFYRHKSSDHERYLMCQEIAKLLNWAFSKHLLVHVFNFVAQHYSLQNLMNQHS